MSEPVVAQPPGGPASPGAMLRAAREKQGLHIAALAAAIKVSPRKLDALENDRWQDLPDATFARALAQTMCRTLKVDPRPILERLPRADTGGLAQVGGSLNMPFDDAAPRAEGLFSRLSLGPMVVASAVLMLAAVLLYFVPIPWGKDDELAVPQPVLLAPPTAPDSAAEGADTQQTDGASAAEPAAAEPAVTDGAAPAGGAAPVAAALPAPPGTASLAAPAAARVDAPADAPVVAPAPAAPVTTVTPGAGTPAAPAATGLLRIRTTDASWVEVRDADDRVLLSRVVEPGEALGLDGAAPLRLVVGNAGATEVQFRGRPLDLAPLTRNNVVLVTLR